MGAMTVTTKKIQLKDHTKLTQYKGPEVGAKMVFPAGHTATYRKSEETVPGLPGVKFAHHRVLVFRKGDGSWVRRKWLPLTPVRVKLLPAAGYDMPATRKGLILRLVGKNMEHPDKAVVALEGEELFTAKWPLIALKLLSIAVVEEVLPLWDRAHQEAYEAGLAGHLFNGESRGSHASLYDAWKRGYDDRKTDKQAAKMARAVPTYSVADMTVGDYQAGPFLALGEVLKEGGQKGWVIIREEKGLKPFIIRRWNPRLERWGPPYNKAATSSDVAPEDTTPPRKKLKKRRMT